jgi:tetratricopeptide (TPR) repeat protein
VAEQGRSDRSRRRAPGRDGVTQSKAEGAGQRPEPKLQRRGDRQRREVSGRTPRPTQSARPGLARRRNEPPIPEGVDSRSLHVAVRAELRSLPKDLAEIVAAHLVVAGRLIDDDPEQAYAHAEAARRRAARLPIVREAAAETAYAAGLYDVALTEFRALRRMTGTPDYLPVMADCERALGRPHNALKLALEADRAGLDPALRIEMIIVEAGARRDLGQDHESLRILERAVDRARPESVSPRAVARLRYAYADALLAAGRESEARHQFASAARLDHDHETDAQQRTDELDGFLIDYDEGDEVASQSLHEPEQDSLE